MLITMDMKYQNGENYPERIIVFTLLVQLCAFILGKNITFFCGYILFKTNRTNTKNVFCSRYKNKADVIRSFVTTYIFMWLWYAIKHFSTKTKFFFSKCNFKRNQILIFHTVQFLNNAWNFCLDTEVVAERCY